MPGCVGDGPRLEVGNRTRPSCSERAIEAAMVLQGVEEAGMEVSRVGLRMARSRAFRISCCSRRTAPPPSSCERAKSKRASTEAT